MNVPLFLMTSTSGAPAAASISMPSRVSLATDRRVHLGVRTSGLSGDLRVGIVWRRHRLAPGLGVDEVDDRLRRLHAVGVLVVVVAQVLVREARELVFVVVHVIEEVDGVAEGAAGLNRLVREGFHA